MGEFIKSTQQALEHNRCWINTGYDYYCKCEECDLAPVFALSPYLPHEGAQSLLSSLERQKGGGGEREADQGLTHHSRDPSSGHVRVPEFCLTMSRMVVCQEGSLAEEGMERQEEMQSCPPVRGRSEGGRG